MTDNVSHTSVLVGFDGSAGAQRALGWAIEAARRAGAPLRLLMAVPVGNGSHQDRYHEVLAAAQEIVGLAVAEVRLGEPWLRVDGTVRRGRPADVLIRAARDADLVVVGRRRRHEVMDPRLGSVSTDVCAHAHCPVVVVPPEWAGRP
ncbi:universal stress protein [Yinghuangia seranimata]|uniref:universal stress protein n=1 Tax=Yinghuangia seranimata TaxID=408067 RepID=UPI00248AAD6B|nr:universal stress protein [Yinghuangia seranimata]MDI2124797.1 universal stress protein [Yinghuangia seranimata]